VSVWLSRSGQINGAGVRTAVEAVEAVADMVWVISWSRKS
jgi:hypothetical protein